MRRFLFVSLAFVGFSMSSLAQNADLPTDKTEVILENDGLKVTEYISNPGKDVCGPGKHSHVPHLSILLTEANVRLTTEDGQTQDIDLKAGTTFWSEAETHTVINTGDQPVKVYLIETK